MKKLSVLALLAVLAVIAAPAAMAATTWAWAGEVTSGFMTDFTTAIEGQSNMYVNLTATINPILSVTAIDFVSATGPTWGITNGNGVADAALNVGTLLGLDPKMIGEVVTVGYFAPGATEYNVSTIALEDTLAASAAWAAPSLQVQSLTTINGMINVQLALDPGSFVGATATPLYLADVYGTVGPLSLSLAYGSSKDQHFDVKFAQAFGDISFAANVQEDYSMATTPGALKLGFGASVAYKTLVTFGIGTAYNVTSAAVLPLGINLDFAPAATWGADVFARMGLDGSGFTANPSGVEASVWFKADASTVRVGYTYTTTSFVVDAAKVQANGGLFAQYDVTF